jgi:hypothetical protein
MEPQLNRKTLYEREQDKKAADFLKERLPYAAKLELREPKYQQVKDMFGSQTVKIKQYIRGVIVAIDHAIVTLQDAPDKEPRKISFELIKKIHPHESPED